MKLTLALSSAVLALSLATPSLPADAATVTPAPGYSITTFAAGPAGTSAADSVLVIGNNVYIGYGNGGAPDGSDGKSSTIAEFSRNGVLLGTTSVLGHNDGLRYDAAQNRIWSLQNEDGNANLVLITPGSLAKSPAINLNSVNGGGGFDDALFTGGKAYVSASNPFHNPNTSPAIVSATSMAAPPSRRLLCYSEAPPPRRSTLVLPRP